MTSSSNISSFTLLDYSRVQTTLLEVLLCDIVGFIGYASLLYIYCVLWDGIVRTLVLLSTQLVIGLTATRVHHTLGRKTRMKLNLFDPSNKGAEWKIEKTDLNHEDLIDIIQLAYSQIPEENLNNIDDYNDIGWFIVLIWSIFSAAIASMFDFGIFYCLIGALVVATVCLMTFINGYHSVDLGFLEGEVNHLEFFIFSRLDKLDLINKQFRKRMFVEWISKSDKMALYDFGFVVSIIEDNFEYCTISYYLGLPLQMNERFEVQGVWNPDSPAVQELKSLSSQTSWSIDQTSLENYTLLHFSNNTNRIPAGMQALSNINLDDVENDSKEVFILLEEILDICSAI